MYMCYNTRCKRTIKSTTHIIPKLMYVATPNVYGAYIVAVHVLLLLCSIEVTVHESKVQTLGNFGPPR